MSTELQELRLEVKEALEGIWFLESVEEIERTDITVSLRLHIRPMLFVHVFLGTKSGSLYMALIEAGRRLYGIDREAGDWHVHPFGAVDVHESLPQGMGPKPILEFLARVEGLLIEHDLL